jgi:catechol 2,3-dioxygenase-like lactoylglutathione lyase family enzyme
MNKRLILVSMTLLGLLAICFSIVTSGAAARAGSAEAAAASRPPITGVAFVMLRTSNYQAAEQFYGQILGLAKFSYRVVLDPAPPSAHQQAIVFPPEMLPEALSPHVGSDTGHTRFYVNEHQHVEIVPGLAGPTQDRLVAIAFETADAEKLQQYLKARNVAILGRTDLTNPGFIVKDPDGHLVAFVQYQPDAMYNVHPPGQDQQANRISQRIIHVGVTVGNRARANRFYRDILGFHETWHGGMTDDKTDWVDMRVPEGTDWLEYMLNVNNPSPRTLGVMHHLALGVPSVDAGYQAVVARGLKPEKPQIGRDGKWQLNLYDPDYTRVELMEPKPVRAPCCSPIVE